MSHRRGEPSILSVFRAIQLFANLVYPGNLGCELTIRLPDGKSSTLTIPAYGSTPAAEAGESDPDAAMSSLEREVMQVFREAEEGAVLGKDDIAGRIGCEPSSRLAEALARLVRLGRLVNRRPGYTLSGS